MPQMNFPSRSSNFERLVQAELESLNSAVWRLPLGDGLKLAKLQGLHEGLTQSLKLYKKSIGGDLDLDGDDIE